MVEWTAACNYSGMPLNRSEQRFDKWPFVTNLSTVDIPSDALRLQVSECNMQHNNPHRARCGLLRLLLDRHMTGTNVQDGQKPVPR